MKVVGIGIIDTVYHDPKEMYTNCIRKKIQVIIEKI